MLQQELHWQYVHARAHVRQLIAFVLDCRLSQGWQ